MSKMKWAYGITTVPSRLNTTFPDTVRSLYNAGFTIPNLFIDNCKDSRPYSSYSKSITRHYPKLGAYGTWITAAWELYCREPEADRYALFQDDILAVSFLREYMEGCPDFYNCYWNCYTAVANQEALPENAEGWYVAPKRGLGALALVFSNDCLTNLMGHSKLVGHPRSKQGHKRIDGVIREAAEHLGMKELINSISLVQHMGEETTIAGNRKHPQAVTFPGEKHA